METHEEMVARAYDFLTPLEDPLNQFLINHDEFVLFDTLFRDLGGLRDKSVLDLGCGVARHCNPFLAVGANYYGIDVSQVSLEIAKRNNPKGKFLHMSGNNLAFVDESFDAVWSMYSLHHQPKNKMPNLLGEVHRVLKKTGKAVLMVIDGDYDGLMSSVDGSVTAHKSCYMNDEFSDELDRAGFAITSVKSDDYLGLSGLHGHVFFTSKK